jgi:hypothetical protein
MKYIKIKVKTVLLLVIASIIFITFSSTIYWSGIKLYNYIAPDNMSINIEEIATTSLKSENKRLELLLSESDYSLYNLVNISGGMMSGSNYIRFQDGQKVYERLEEFGEEKDIYENNPDYVLNVILVQWFSGHTECAEELLSRIDVVNLNDNESDYYYLIKTGIDLTYNRIDDVIESLEGIKGEEYSGVINSVKEFVHVFYDVDIKFNSQEQSTKHKDNMYNDFYGELIRIVEVTHFKTNHLNVENDSIDEYANENNKDVNIYDSRMENNPIDKSVNGKITLNNEPVQGVFIYERIDNSSSSSDGFDNEVFITDEKGEYSIERVGENTRDLGILIPWQLVFDKQFNNDFEVDRDNPNDEEVNFDFSEGVYFSELSVEGDRLQYKIEDSMGADDRYYLINISYADSGFDINGKLIDLKISSKEMEGELSISELLSLSGYPFDHISRCEDELEIKRFLEPLYLGADYYFKVYPYEDNHIFYISNSVFSDSLATRIFVEGNDEMNEGDRLLSEKKVDEAIEWYKQNVSEHNLKVLTSLYRRGMIPYDAEYGQKLEGKDYSEAIKYLEILIDQYGKTYERCSGLARLYGEVYKYEKQVEVLNELYESSGSIYTMYNLAGSLINIGKYSDGIELLKENGDFENDRDRFFHHLLLTNEIEKMTEKFKNNYQAVLETNDYSSFFEQIQNGEYLSAYEWLDNQVQSDGKIFFQLMMYDSISNDEFSFQSAVGNGEIENKLRFSEFYKTETLKVKDQRIKNLLIDLKDDYYWFD